MMANYQNLKAAIDQVIKANGQKEITGPVLNDTLKAIVNSLGAGYQFMGVATPSTNPGTPDQNVFYIAGQGGTYTNFNSIVLPNGVSVLKWNGSWSGETVVAGDGVFDISAYKATGGTLATFADLSAALDDGNNIPQPLRKGGMSVKFVQSSDNKYVQYRLMTDSWSTNTENWAIAEEGVYIENPEFIYVKTDAEGKILWAIKTDGSIYYGTGVPQQVIDYVEEKISSLSLDEYEDIVTFLGDLIDGDTLTTLLNTKLDAEGLDADALETVQAVENPEYIQVTTDSEDKIIEAITNKGRKQVNIPIDTPSVSLDSISNPEWIQVTTDSEGRILEGITTDGKKKVMTEPLFENKTIGEIAIEEFENKDTLDKFSENNGHLLWNDSLIEGNGITQEEADSRYAAISINETVDNQTAQISSLNNTVSTLVESATPLSNINKIINAADFGFDPENNASDNVSAINTALYGGNKTVIVSKPGTYMLDDTILMDDNTTLICGDGVVFKKESSTFVYMFLNRGASTRIENKNISIIGGTFCINNNSHLDEDLSNPLWGLRGLISFVCVRNLTIDRITIPDLLNAEYGIHINTFNNIVIKNSTIAGNKDGIHISDGEHFTISHCYLNCNDDPIAMNSSDWCTSNCVDGTLKYGLIENCITEGTGRYLFNVGAIVDWYSGMSIKRGDRVVNNGYVYKAIIGLNEPEKFSETAPTIDNYSGVQDDAGGFKWKLMRKSAFYTTNVEDVTIRNCHSYTNRIMEGCSSDGIYSGTFWGRELYPTVQVENYPHVTFKVESCVFDTLFMNYNDKVNDDIVFERTTIPKRIGMLGKVNGVSSRTVLRDCDFSINQDSDDITLPQNMHLIIDGARGREYLKFEDNAAQGRIESNFPCNITTFTGTQKKGDMVKIQDGTIKIYNGTSWSNLV